MYCKKCGKPNENDAVFCKSCGARLGTAAAYQPKPNTAASPKRAKKKSPVIIVIAVLAVIAIAVTIFAVSTALAVGKYGRKNYEDVVSEYVGACCDLDGEKLLSLYPKDLVEEIYEHSGVSEEDVYRYYSNWLSTTEIFSASLDDTWEISFDSEEPYGYTGIQRIEPMYRKAGFDFDLEDGTTIKYSLRYSKYEAEWDHRNIELDLIKVGGRWYIDDVLMNDVFFDQDLSEIASIVQGIDERELIAKYLGCDPKRLRGPIKHTIDGESHFTFEYWNGHGNYFDYQLYLLQDGNNIRVMARYWNKTIPVEELSEGERDSSWKITFTNTAQQQEPQGTEDIAPDNNMISAFPDGDKSKTPVIYYDTNNKDISEEDEKSLAAEQRPALIQYLGCGEDNLWAGHVVCTQGDVTKIGFWYVDDYEEIADNFIILLEDDTAAWCDDDILYEHSGEGIRITGTLSVRTIDRHTFYTEETAGDLIDARKLSESEQRNLIAEYLGCSANELTYYQTNQAQRMEFESTNNEIYGLMFLLDDGTVAIHNDGEPPYRAEGVGDPYAGGQIVKHSMFMGEFISSAYGGSANLSILEADGMLTVAYDYMGDRAESFCDVFYSPYDELEIKEGEVYDSYDMKLIYSKDSHQVTLEYTPAEKSTYNEDTITLIWYENGSFRGIDFLVRDIR